MVRYNDRDYSRKIIQGDQSSYEDESNYENVVKTTVVSVTNYVQTGKNNSRYRLYAEAPRAKIKSSIDSLQECSGGTHNPKGSGRYRITGFLTATGFSHLAAVTGAVRQ